MVQMRKRQAERPPSNGRFTQVVPEEAQIVVVVSIHINLQGGLRLASSAYLASFWTNHWGQED